MEQQTTSAEAAPPRPRTCGSCRFWDVRIARSRALENSVAYCRLPEFAPLHLVVSGTSACDRWTPLEG